LWYWNKLAISTISFFIILSSVPIAYAGFLPPVVIFDGLGDSNGLDIPQAIATDPSGNVFVTGESTDNVFKIDTPGTCSTGGTTCTITQIINWAGDGSGNRLDAPLAGVATDLSGNVFVTGFFSDNVFKITPGGVITQIMDSTGDGSGNELDQPFGVATDSSGNVFVVGHASDNVFKITPSGVITQIIDRTGDGSGNELIFPWAITTDPSGNVFVTGQISHNIFKITPGGVITEIIDKTGDGDGFEPFIRPKTVATDLAGNVFSVGRGSNAYKIATPGTCSTGGTPCTITEIMNALGDGSSGFF